LETLDGGYIEGSEKHSRPYDAVHVKTLEVKHFLDSIPGYCFRFCHDDTKNDTEQKKFKKFHENDRFGVKEEGG